VSPSERTSTGEKHFTGTPTEPRYAREEKWARFGRSQGAASRQLGEHVLRPMNKQLDKYGLEGLQQSPGTAQALTELIFGAFATYGWALADKYADPNGPAMLTDELPVISRILERPEKYSKVPRQFYALVKSIDEAYATLKKYEGMERDDIVDEYEEMPEIDLVPDMRGLLKDIRELDRQREELYMLRDDSMTPEQKALVEEELRREKLELMREGIELGREEGVRIEP